MLSLYDPDTPRYLGKRFRHSLKQGYMSGGGSYVLSREAVKRLVTGLSNQTSDCIGPASNEPEDVLIGQCLEGLGIRPGDSRDAQGRERFHATGPGLELSMQLSWMYQFTYHPHVTGEGCCSEHSVSFHYVSPQDMLTMDFLIYNLRVYNENPGPDPHLDRNLLPPAVLNTTLCEHSNIGLTCWAEGYVLNILSASWGRGKHTQRCRMDPNTTLLAQAFNATCFETIRATQLAKDLCDGKTLCDVRNPTRAEESFGVPKCDLPLPGKLPLLLELEYTCQPQQKRQLEGPVF
jgi:hypothetical protein